MDDTADLQSVEAFVLLQEAWPDVAGRPGLTQGRYGEAGNLELVVPAVDDGLLVGWFNCDPTDARAGAAVQRWSGTLRFGRGRRYASADITQVDGGPDFLEVVAVTTAGTVRRHVWSPGPGFVDHGDIIGSVATCSGMVQSAVDGSLHVVVTGLDRQVRLLRAAVDAYPELTWHVAELGISGVSAVDAAWHQDHLDVVTVGADGSATLWCGAEGTAGRGVGTCVAARLLAPPGRPRLLLTQQHSGLLAALAVDAGANEHDDLGTADGFVAANAQGGGRAECHVVVRRGQQLWHLRLGESAVETSLVAAEVWSAPQTVSVHRG